MATQKGAPSWLGRPRRLARAWITIKYEFIHWRGEWKPDIRLPQKRREAASSPPHRSQNYIARACLRTSFATGLKVSAGASPTRQ